MDDGTSWRRGLANQPETAATDLEEAGAMARSDLEPEDQAAIIAVLEYVITNFRSASTYPGQRTQSLQGFRRHLIPRSFERIRTPKPDRSISFQLILAVCYL